MTKLNSVAEPHVGNFKVFWSPVTFIPFSAKPVFDPKTCIGG